MSGVEQTSPDRVDAAVARVEEATRAARIARVAAARPLRERAARRSRWLRITMVCAALLVVCGLVSIIWLVVVGGRQEARVDEQRGALEAARGAVDTMLTATPGDASGYADRVIARSTGAEHDRLSAARDALVAAVSSARTGTSGRVVAAGLISDPTSTSDGARAEALVTAQASDPALVGADPDADVVTVRLSLERVDGAWKIARLVPV
ncbi:hypothetical protein [Gordonia otitidis]|uniref:Mce-associated membrane protein n=1 Tax=Gordonia otitidis (strain DSM 44809 / CCUG 52243 / JCM 12355 / NBRC 100426 / IFM 10032) TaxID=1108044 RepID=H5TFW9_GORO1|nr:hypothetical protein [Gordonia otitidis]GAB32377.1 hypothetical protein GOOTI_005_00550 [Gordonia otitidis NBRC 100426]